MEENIKNVFRLVIASIRIPNFGPKQEAEIRLTHRRAIVLNMHYAYIPCALYKV